MRITGGELCGRRLRVPGGLSVRPTSDKVREALFQILTVRMERAWEDCRVLDLFAGSGALGLEALSRGAREAVFVDRSRGSLDVVRRNLVVCGYLPSGRLVRADIPRRGRALEAVAEEGPYDVVFADPPYGTGLAEGALEWVARAGVLAGPGWMVVEEERSAVLPETVSQVRGKAALVLVDRRSYGQTKLWFYWKGEGA